MLGVDDGRRALDVGVEQRRRPGSPSPSPRGSVVHRAARRRSASAIRLSAGGMICEPSPQVDLVAVVVRRVVGRRHHDAGARVRGGGSRRPAPGSATAAAGPGREARRRPQLGGVPGEHVGVVPCVVADHDRLLGVSVSPAGRRPARRRRVRTTTRFIRFGPAPSSPAQPGGAELERRAEAVGEPVVRLGARRGLEQSGQQGAQFAPGLLVGVLIHPGLDVVAAVRRCRSSQIFSQHVAQQGAHPARRRVPGVDDLLARSTAVPLIPAAALVTSEMPSTSMPASRAAMASSTVRHADQVGAERPQHPDLGRGLVVRAGQLRVDALGERRVDLAGTARAAAASTGRSGRRSSPRRSGTARSG